MMQTLYETAREMPWWMHALTAIAIFVSVLAGMLRPWRLRAWGPPESELSPIGRFNAGAFEIAETTWPESTFSLRGEQICDGSVKASADPLNELARLIGQPNPFVSPNHARLARELHAGRNPLDDMPSGKPHDFEWMAVVHVYELLEQKRKTASPGLALTITNARTTMLRLWPDMLERADPGRRVPPHGSGP